VHRTDLGRVGDDAGKVDQVCLAQVRQQDLVQLGPHARYVPLVQPVPQRHPTAAHLVGEVLPRDAGLEDEEDPGEAHAVIDARVTAQRAGGVLR